MRILALLILIFTVTACSMLNKLKPQQKVQIDSISTEAPQEVYLWDEFNEILKIAGEPLYFQSNNEVFYHTYINYKKLSSNPEIRALTKKQKQKLSLTSIPEEKQSQISFWLNTLNFLVISEITEKFHEIKSSKNIDLKTPKHTISGNDYSIDQIFRILRDYQDPRIHFAVNFGNISSPSLKLKAYDAKTLDQDLDRQVSNALKNPIIMRIEKNIFNKEQINLSTIFDWFESDFVDVLEFVRKHAPAKAAKLNRYKAVINYNWDFNTKANIIDEMESIRIDNPKLIQEPKLSQD